MMMDRNDLDRQIFRIENAARLGMLACADEGNRLSLEQTLDALNDHFEAIIEMAEKAYEMNDAIHATDGGAVQGRARETSEVAELEGRGGED